MTTPESSKIRVPKEKIIKLSELVENPFKERICESFSKDGLGNLNFEEVRKIREKFLFRKFLMFRNFVAVSRLFISLL